MVQVRPIPEGIVLSAGSHARFEDGVSVMELTAYVAGEPHSDHPGCVHQVIAFTARKINNYLGTDTERALLIPFIPRMIGTNDGVETTQTLACTAADVAVRTFAADAMQSAGLTQHADRFRSLPEIVNAETALNAAKVVGSFGSGGGTKSDTKAAKAAIKAAKAAMDAAASSAYAAAAAAVAASFAYATAAITSFGYDATNDDTKRIAYWLQLLDRMLTAIGH